MTTQRYQHGSEHFLAQARGGLADGDLPPASVKGWGAAVRILKAVAERRGWEHSRRRIIAVASSAPPATSTRISTWTRCRFWR